MPLAKFEDAAIDELLVELEALRREYLVERDFSRLATLFADDLTYVHSIGTVQDKSTYLSHVQGIRFLSIQRDGLAVKVYGDVAVMAGGMTNTISVPDMQSPMVVHAFVTQVWMRDAQAGWRITNFQATRLPAGEAKK